MLEVMIKKCLERIKTVIPVKDSVAVYASVLSRSKEQMQKRAL